MTSEEIYQLFSNTKYADWFQYDTTSTNVGRYTDWLSNQTTTQTARELFLQNFHGNWDCCPEEYEPVYVHRPYDGFKQIIGVDLSKKPQELEFDSENTQLDDFLQSFSRKEESSR